MRRADEPIPHDHAPHGTPATAAAAAAGTALDPAQGPDPGTADFDRVALDRVDKALVAELQRDGRQTYEALAAAVGVSRAAARSRVLRLLDARLVRVVAVVHPRVAGRTSIAHLAVTADGPAGPVARGIADLPESVFVTLTAGRAAVAAEVRADSFEALSRAVDRVRALPGVAAADALPYTRVVKDPYALPHDLDTAATETDELDRAIMALLEQDGRQSFADLAARVGLSAGATRARTLRMLDAGVFRVVALVEPGVLGATRLLGTALSVAGPDALTALTAADGVQFVATCLGRADAVATLGADSTAAVLDVLEDVRRLPGVRVLDSWLHMRMVKERYDVRNGG
ncbi:Lrp/AsnC family transcriptional regulator [Streptodolium elevatio]